MTNLDQAYETALGRSRIKTGTWYINQRYEQARLSVTITAHDCCAVSAVLPITQHRCTQTLNCQLMSVRRRDVSCFTLCVCVLTPFNTLSDRSIHCVASVFFRRSTSSQKALSTVYKPSITEIDVS